MVRVIFSKVSSSKYKSIITALDEAGKISALSPAVQHREEREADVEKTKHCQRQKGHARTSNLMPL